MKTSVTLIIAIAAQAVGNVCLSKGMKGIAGASGIGDLLPVVLQVFGNPAIWLGTGFLLVFFLLYAAALSWADLSFVLPATSFGYVVNVACGYFFLNEAVAPARWAGAVLIFLGVAFVSRSGSRTGGSRRADQTVS